MRPTVFPTESCRGRRTTDHRRVCAGTDAARLDSYVHLPPQTVPGYVHSRRGCPMSAFGHGSNRRSRPITDAVRSAIRHRPRPVLVSCLSAVMPCCATLSRSRLPLGSPVGTVEAGLTAKGRHKERSLTCCDASTLIPVHRAFTRPLLRLILSNTDVRA